MEDLLGSLLGGAEHDPEEHQGSGDPLSDLLGGMLGGGSSGGEGDLGGLLEGMLGGGATGGSGDMGGLLEGLVGGGGQQGAAGGMGDIFGALLGGGSSTATTGAGSFLAPIISGVAEKLGLSPQIAQAIVGFVMGKLFAGRLGGGEVPGAVAEGDMPAGQAGLELDQIVQQLGSGQGLDTTYLRSTGMPEELAAQTGLDPETATAGIQEVFNLLGGQLSGG